MPSRGLLGDREKTSEGRLVFQICGQLPKEKLGQHFDPGLGGGLSVVHLYPSQQRVKGRSENVDSS